MGCQLVEFIVWVFCGGRVLLLYTTQSIPKFFYFSSQIISTDTRPLITFLAKMKSE